MKKRIPVPVEQEAAYIKDFFDLIAPGVIRFFVDYYIVGNTFRCAWAVREYPPVTNGQAILSRLGERENITLRIYSRYVDAVEQRKVVQNATRKNRMMTGGTNIQDTITAEGNLKDVVELITNMRENKEPLLHCAVYLELSAESLEKLKELQTEIQMELTRERIAVDRLTLRQKEGFLSVMPVGYNAFEKQFERILPASSVANLYPYSYSGKTDAKGFYIGRDKFGTNILTDLDARADDKTNGSALILGNSGQGKSYLLKLLLLNARLAGKAIICLDAEQEYEDLTRQAGGCYLDLMTGEYRINPLEPRTWGDGERMDDDEQAPEAFRKSSRLSQHISFLKDFFRTYKDFSDAHIDALEILAAQLYRSHGITDYTDFSALGPEDYPIMSELYDLLEAEYRQYKQGGKSLFTEDLLRELCLGLHSMCKGAESKYFNGTTNITSDQWITFGVRGLLDTNKRLKDTMLFNILAYMNHHLLIDGCTVASIDELYLFLTNLTAIEYIRNAEKRVRKKDSALYLASQNIEDFLIEGVREYTKPLFAIPAHQFLFNAGNINPKDYIDALQLEESEFELIKYPDRGSCLYKCGNERYLLQVIAPEYKAALFGSAGGR